jgi:hypothetical protein
MIIFLNKILNNFSINTILKINILQISKIAKYCLISKIFFFIIYNYSSNINKILSFFHIDIQPFN